MRYLMWVLVPCGLISIDSATNSAQAQIRRFPYQATIAVKIAYVRSGPGHSYYPTSKLANGQTVTVHRHDPGGWYMIAPPAGSFSWVRAEYVQQTSRGQGVLTKSNVVVRVGSSFGDDRDIEQVRLSKGARVTIVGETTASTQFGAVKMLKIASPRGEFRWLSGRDLVPVGRASRQANDTNPYAIPSNAVRQSATTQNDPTSSGPALSGPSLKGGNRSSRSSVADIDLNVSRSQAQIGALDATFREMVRRDKRLWDFTSLESGYSKIHAECGHAAIRRKVATRLASIKRHQQIKTQYEDIIRLTSQTSETESRLAAAQQRLAGGGNAPETFSNEQETTIPQVGNQGTPMPPSQQIYQQPPSSQPAVLPAPGVSSNGQPVRLAPPVPGSPVPGSPNSGPLVPDPRYSDPTIPGAAASPTPQFNQHPGGRSNPTPINSTQFNPVGRRTQAMQPRRFDGAGVIRRVVARSPGMPRHALVAPNGRILAYLEGVPGLPLDKYVGRPMGVYGQRTRRQDLRNDHITVRAMMPVKLRP